MRLKLYRGKFYAVSREGGTTKRRSLRTSDRGEAERRLADISRARSRSEYAGDAGSVAEILAAYLAEKKETARGYQGMESAWRAARGTFGNLRPDQISRDVCRVYISRRQREGVKLGTVIKEIGVVRAGIRWGRLGHLATFALPATPPPRDRYLTKNEVSHLIDSCTLPHVKLFILLAWSTGARAGAILSLKWDRVDFERSQIRLADGRSGSKGRATVPMTDRLRAALYEAQKGAMTEWVIEWGGGQVKTVKRAFASACKRADIEDCSPHVLRHSAAVAMAEDGVSMAEIAQVLGHTNVAVTFSTYARFSPGHLKKAIRALE